MLDANGQPIPDTTVETPATGNAPAPAKPEDTVDYWKQQYNGKNGTAVKLQGQNAALALEKENLLGKISDLETQSEAKVQAALAEAAAAKETARLAQQEAAQYQKANAVRTIAAAPEYTNAAKLLDEDDFKLLSGMPEADVKAYLLRQEAKLTKFVTGTESERNLGTPPQAPPSGDRKPPVVDLKQLSSSLEEATAKFGFNSPEYKAAYDAHLRGVMASSTPL